MKKTNKQETCKHCGNEFHPKLNYKEFYNSIKNFMRNLGKSNMIVKYEIQDIIDEFEMGEK